MREIANTIPDVDMLLALAPEELAAKLLFLVRTRFKGTMFHPNNLYRELWETFRAITYLANQRGSSLSGKRKSPLLSAGGINVFRLRA